MFYDLGVQMGAAHHTQLHMKIRRIIQDLLTF